MALLTRQKVRFGPFDLDPSSGELFKLGYKLNLRGQPIEVLSILLERPGEVVTREELCKRLWPQDTFVDFEHSLNTAIKKLRQALDDDVETPRYVETLPKKGYRFVAQTESACEGQASLDEERKAARVEREVASRRSKWWLRVFASLFVLAAVGGVAYRLLRPRVPVVTGIRQLTRTENDKRRSSAP